MRESKFFPLAVFPKEIRSIIEQTHNEYKYPINYIAAALFFAMSVSIGNSRVLVINQSWKVKPILFMALMGGSGAMKTPPIRFAVNPLIEIDNITLGQYKTELKEWKKSTSESRGDKPIAKQLRIQDVTLEALIKILDNLAHGVFAYIDELNGWVASFNRYHGGGGDLQQWLSLHSGVPVSVNRKTDDEVISVSNPFVGVIGGIQPRVMPRIFAGEKMDNGFFFRLLFVNNSSEGEPLLWNECQDLPTEIENQWASIVRKILEKGGYFNEEHFEEYHLSPEAWNVIQSWQSSIETSNLELEDYKTAIFRKIQDYSLRFAIVIHTMREVVGAITESDVIDAESAVYATILADYFYEQAQIAYEIVMTGGDIRDSFFNLLRCLDDTFTTGQALVVGEQLGLSRATIYRLLSVGPNDPFVRRLRHGRYEKIK